MAARQAIFTCRSRSSLIRFFSAITTTCTAKCRSVSRRRRSAEIRIPTETQSGKIFRLRGKGIRGVRSREHGDLLCHVVVETPVNLTDRQRELLREFEAISQTDSDRHNPRAKS